MAGPDILTLPWQIQVALASGYAGYMLAYTGLRSRHSAVDTAFLTLVFGLAATLVLTLASRAGVAPIAAGTAALVATCLVSFVWRKWLRAEWRRLVRWLNLSWANDDASAWDSLGASTNYFVTQIAVQLDDGRWLRCDEAQKFADAPFGPCQLGPSGDVALYLTHADTAPGDEKGQTSVRDAHFGDRITYVPAARIRLINLRYLPRA